MIKSEGKIIKGNDIYAKRGRYDSRIRLRVGQVGTEGHKKEHHHPPAFPILLFGHKLSSEQVFIVVNS